MTHLNGGMMEANCTLEITEGERNNLLNCPEHSAQEKTTVCGLANLKIMALPGNEKLVLVIAFVCCAIIFSFLGMGIAVALAPAQCGPPCPHYWIGYEGKCYYFSNEERNWTSSQQFCTSHNASLARIASEEKDFVMRFKGRVTCWIGLRRVPGGPWTWPDGEKCTLEVTGGGDCACLDNEAKAISLGCHTKLPWICSKPAACTKPQGASDS